MFLVFLRRFVEFIPGLAEHAMAGPPAVEFGGLRDPPAILFSSGFPSVQDGEAAAAASQR